MRRPPPKFFDDVLVEIEARTHFFDRPDIDHPNCDHPDFFHRNFDPRDPQIATDAVLGHYGLPRRPNPDTHPVRFAFWNKMFTPPKSRERVSFVNAKDGFDYEKLPKRTMPPIPGEPAGGHQESSLNWSGAYVTPRDGRMFTEVHAAWRVPGVRRPADQGSADGPRALVESSQSSEYRSSTWIGLDGQRRYFNASLPQIGTSQFVGVSGIGSVTKTPPGVWWQWWLKDAANPLPILLPLPVRVGDLIMASIFIENPTQVKFLIANHTQGIVCTPFIETEPTSYLGEYGPPGPVRVSGATAEWIMERPTNWVTKEIFDLPDYDAVNFEDCHVMTGRAPKVDEREERPFGARLVTMFDIRNNPYRSTKVSVARRSGRDRFTTTNLRPSNVKRSGSV